MNLEEIERFNECDENFVKWHLKYPQTAKRIRNTVVILTYKFFFFPFSHFFGFLHFTMRTQDHLVVWQPDNELDIAMKNRDPNIKVKGKLVPRSNKQEFYFNNEFEGGRVEKQVVETELMQRARDFPRYSEERVGDQRVLEAFRRAVKIDIIGMRLIMIIGNLLLILVVFIKQKPSQLMITCIENLILSLIMVGLQLYLLKHWEAQRLPLKMRDNKANYIFKGAKQPNEDTRDYDLERENLLPE
jgi:hypothetical protein